jgi:23S rRNA (guanine745-N1)-methyltransferase
MLLCPICSALLTLEEKVAVCPQGHSFDRARQGYFNLLPNSSSKGHGDDGEMLRARRAFLEKGYYSPLANAICRVANSVFPKGGVMTDAGCGEGYYTKMVRDTLTREGKEPAVFAFDIAKDAVRMTAGKLEKKGVFFVASAFHIPLASESVDLMLSLFAPYSEEEYLRVLRPGGYLLRAVPLENHLYSLKCAVYDHPTRNEAKAEVSAAWEEVLFERIEGEIHLSSSEEILALFGMTPYVHKTGKKDMEKLEKLQSITTQTDFGILLTRKKP